MKVKKNVDCGMKIVDSHSTNVDSELCQTYFIFFKIPRTAKYALPTDTQMMVCIRSIARESIIDTLESVYEPDVCKLKSG